VLAVVAVAMFIGAWVIGPALTHGSRAPAPTKDRPMSYQAMLERPDPSPYRAPTPAFDMSARPGYGVAAREKAREALGERRATSEDATVGFGSQSDGDRYYRAGRYPAYDRTAIH
jgi:hypothetical protein